MFGKTENEFKIDMRIAFRDGNDDVIDLGGSSNEFKLNVKGTGETSSCEDAMAQLDSAAYVEKDLLFKSTEYIKDVYVKQAMKVQVIGNNTECRPQFKLSVWEPSSDPLVEGKWVSWTKMKQWIQTQANISLQSKVTFNVDTAELSATFSKEEVEDFRDFLVDNGKSSLDFKISVIVPGSL
jgi:hypothetical protein